MIQKAIHLSLMALLFCLFAGANCTPKPDPVIPEDTEQCPAACEHMRRMPVTEGSGQLGCAIAADLDDGRTCEVFCVEFQSEGVPLKPSCILDQTACDKIETNCFQHPK